MIDILNSLIWSGVIICLLFVGMLYSKKLKFLQFKFYKLLSPLKNKDNIKALCISLGGKIGVGSLSGIAIAIYYGGIGVIFWIWLCSLITSIMAYVETYLGVVYEEKECSGTFYYLKNGLNNKMLSYIYAILLIFTFIIGFNSIQTNTIIKCLNFKNIFFVKIILMFVFAYIIFKGKEMISKVSSIMVPIMMLLYVFVGVYIIINNINLVPDIVGSIFEEIFNSKTFFSGLIIGVQRGIFATEIGTGTSSIATSGVKDSPHNQGLCQLFGVHFISFIICTITFLIVILSDYNVLSFSDINGIEIIIHAFNYHLGDIGNIFLILITFLFSFSTVISSYYYGEISLKFLTKVSKKKMFIYKLFTLLFIYLGMTLKSTFIWSLVDIFLGMLTLINIYALFKLRDKVR